jgi:hypothetical protein
MRGYPPPPDRGAHSADPRAPVGSGGVRFVIRSAETAPPELSNQLPATGHTIPTRTDPYADGTLIYANMDEPLKYRLPHDFDIGRCRPEDLDRDAFGPVLWVSAVIMAAPTPDEQPYPGMRHFAVDLAYVLDPSLVPTPSWARRRSSGSVSSTSTTKTPRRTLTGARGVLRLPPEPRRAQQFPCCPPTDFTKNWQT